MQPIQATSAADYRTGVDALEHLIHQQPTPPAAGGLGVPTTLLRTLRQRDRIDLPHLDASDFETVIDTDHRLKVLAKDFNLNHHTWTDWRGLRNPTLEQWWWHLDNLSTGIEGKRSWLDNLTVLMHLLWMIECIVIIQRVFIGGDALVGTVGTVIQVSISFLGLSLIPRGITNNFNTLLVFLGLTPSKFPWPRTRTSLILAALTTLVLWVGLPTWAKWLTDRSNVNNPSTIAQSIRNLRQASNLNPELVQAKVNLSLALETAGQTDEAIRLMQEAILKSNDVRIYQNLARLLTVRAEGGDATAKTDAQRAFGLLENAIVRGKCALPDKITLERELLLCYRVHVIRGRAALVVNAKQQATLDLDMARTYLQKIEKQDTTGLLLGRVAFGIEVQCLSLAFVAPSKVLQAQRDQCQEAIDHLKQAQQPENYYPILNPRWLERLKN
jgi:tetratricopeptide (TPR) repeat protein